jgi:hypothetical protein
MTDETTVPDDADEFFDTDYDDVEDDSHGDDELGDIPNEAVDDIG